MSSDARHLADVPFKHAGPGPVAAVPLSELQPQSPDDGPQAAPRHGSAYLDLRRVRKAEGGDMHDHVKHTCPPCTGACRQGRDCPAERTDYRGLRWVALALLVFWAVLIEVVRGCTS